jgi:hypothetical protein
MFSSEIEIHYEMVGYNVNMKKVTYRKYLFKHEFQFGNHLFQYQF